jgi:hypothetical protein
MTPSTGGEEASCRVCCAVWRHLHQLSASGAATSPEARAVGTCQVLLAVIGPQWVTVADADGRRRLKDPNDFVPG